MSFRGPSRRFPNHVLRSLRNDIPIDELIRRRLDLPSKDREGYLRFLCPLCDEFHTATNPKTNLARCFRCRVNFNPIELVMAVEHASFVDAVRVLLPLLEPTPPGQRRETLLGYEEEEEEPPKPRTSGDPPGPHRTLHQRDQRSKARRRRS
jgi:DNA primase